MIVGDVLTIGENRVFCDIVFTGLPKIPKLGEEIFAKNLDIKAGGAFFTPAGLARLGMKTILSTVLGDDSLSQLVFKRISDEKINTSFIRIKKGRAFQQQLASRLPTVRSSLINRHCRNTIKRYIKK